MKAVVVLSSATLATSPMPSISTRIIFCSHHPCIVGTAKRDAVWRVDLSLSLSKLSSQQRKALMTNGFTLFILKSVYLDPLKNINLLVRE